MFWKWPASAMLGESRDGDRHDQIWAKRRMTGFYDSLKKQFATKLITRFLARNFGGRLVNEAGLTYLTLRANWSCVCLWHETQLWMNLARSLQHVVLSWLPLPPVNQISWKYVKQGAPKALYSISSRICGKKIGKTLAISSKKVHIIL